MKNPMEFPIEQPLDSCQGILLVYEDFRRVIAKEKSILLRGVHPSCLTQEQAIRRAMRQDFLAKRSEIRDIRELQRLRTDTEGGLGIDGLGEQIADRLEDGLVELLADCSVCVLVDLEEGALDLRGALRAAGYVLEAKSLEGLEVPCAEVLCTRMRRRVRIAFLDASIVKALGPPGTERVVYWGLRNTFGVYFAAKLVVSANAASQSTELSLISSRYSILGSELSQADSSTGMDKRLESVATAKQVAAFCELRGAIPLGRECSRTYADTAERFIIFSRASEDPSAMVPAELGAKSVHLNFVNGSGLFFNYSTAGRLVFVAAYSGDSGGIERQKMVLSSLKRLKSFLETEFFVNDDIPF